MPDLATPEAPRICQLLASRRFNFHDEQSLQDGIEEVLRDAGIAYRRELLLDARNRPDFMLGLLGIEVKTQGSIAQFLRQAHRYLEKPEVAALIAVGTPKWLSKVPGTLAGKPLHAVRLTGSLL